MVRGVSGKNVHSSYLALRAVCNWQSQLGFVLTSVRYKMHEATSDLKFLSILGYKVNLTEHTLSISALSLFTTS